jgi:hypothetical protein
MESRFSLARPPPPPRPRLFVQMYVPAHATLACPRAREGVFVGYCSGHWHVFQLHTRASSAERRHCAPTVRLAALYSPCCKQKSHNKVARNNVTRLAVRAFRVSFFHRRSLPRYIPFSLAFRPGSEPGSAVADAISGRLPLSRTASLYRILAVTCRRICDFYRGISSEHRDEGDIYKT